MSHKHFHGLSLALGLISLLVFVGGSCGSTPTTPPAESTKSESSLLPGFSLYENKDFNFSMQYPSDWRKEEAGGEIKVQFFSPVENEEDTFSENLNVVISTLPKQMSFEQFVTINLDQIKQGLLNFKSIETKDETLPAGKARSLIFTGIYGKETDPTLKWRQTFIVSGSKIYVISYTASPDGYDKQLDTAVKMVNSLREIK